MAWSPRRLVAAATGSAVAAALTLCATMLWDVHPGWAQALAIVAVALIAAWSANRIIQGRGADRDALTGLGNRRRLEQALQQQHDSCHRQRKPLTLVLIDVDHFQQFNDALGHHAGNRVLQRVAELVREHARRPGDVAARPGDDRFAMVLPDTSREGALHLVETLIGQVRRMSPGSHDGVQQRLSISVGLYTGIPDAAGACSRFSEGADVALQSAKAAGRDGYFAGPMEPD